MKGKANWHRIGATAAVLALACCCAPLAQADIDTWKSTASGTWGVGSNWTDGTVPGNGDSAKFHQPTLFPTITFNANPLAIQALDVTQGGWVFASSGGARTLNVNSGGVQTATIVTGLVLGNAGNPLHLNAPTLDIGHNTIGPAQFGINHGSHAIATSLTVGTTGGGGIVQADGAGSEVYWSGTANVGAGGFSGELRYQNSSSSSATTTGPLVLANSTVAGTTGVVNVESGAVAKFATLDMASAATDVGTATLNIQGSGSTVTMFSFMRVGNANGGSADVNIGTTISGGRLTAGEAGIQINNTGTVTLASASTNGLLDVNGPIDIIGGDLVVNGGNFQYQQINVSNGGSASFAFPLEIDTDSGISSTEQRVSISNGSISVAGHVNIGREDDNGDLSVSGPNSSIVANSATPSTWGGGGSDFSSISASFTNGASGTFNGGIDIRPGFGGSQAFFSVNSGADVSVGNLSVMTQNGLNTSANVTLTGAGSTLTLTPSSTLTLGHNFTFGTAQLNIENNAVVTVGAGGTTILNASGTINLNGGTFNTPTFTENGTFNFTSGTLGITGPAGLTFGSGGPLGSSYSLGSNRTVSVPNTTTINPGSSLMIDGGTLNTGTLVVNGDFLFNGGTLGFITPGGGWNAPIVIQELDAAISVNAANVSLGSAASFSGFHHAGPLSVASGASVTLNSASYAHLGIVTSLAGGTINAPNGIYLPGGSNLVGNGTVNARVTGDAGSVIDADGALALGDAASPAGFNFDGELRTRQHTVTLLSSSQSSLGNLTTLGNGASPGTLTAVNGLVVDFGDAITGHGTVSSTNSLAKRTIVNGTAQGTSVAQPLTFTGYVKGVGTFDNVGFAGTFSPGLSPTILTVGNIALAGGSTLIMEIGGTTPGSGYDQIQASGLLALGGTLQVGLIDGFTPTIGQSFNLFDWTIVTGTFSSLALPTLSGLTWNTSQLYTNGVLSVTAGVTGDYNNNGIVDAADYVVWRKTDGLQPGYNLWRSNFGRTAGAATIASAFVPEPATTVLVILGGMVSLTIQRARFRRRNLLSDRG